MADFDAMNIDPAPREPSQDTVAVKKEEESYDTPAPAKAVAHINLDTDDEGEGIMAPPPARRQRPTPGLFVTDSPTPSMTPALTTTSVPEPDAGDTGSFDFGPSLFTKQLTAHEKMLATQRKMAVKFRDRLVQPSTPPRPASQVPTAQDLMPSPPQAPQRGKKRGGRDAAAAQFQKAKAAYDKKVSDGSVTVTDEIEFMKLESEEKARLRKLDADDDYDLTPEADDADAEGLFVTDDAPVNVSYSDMFSEGEGDGEASKGRKRKRQASTRDVDADGDGDGDGDGEGTSGPPKKRGRPKKSSKVPGTSYTNEDLQRILNDSAKGRSKKGPAKKTTGAGRRRTGPTMTNLGSIMGTDVFGDAAAVRDLASQPTNFGADQRGGRMGTRNDALKSLIASVSQDDRATAQSDKKYLDDALKHFTGHASVRPAPDGNWSLRGMRSTLRHFQIIGVSFMRKRENAGAGGILADQMGLGKTVMMLANCVNGRPKPGSKIKATLIVASPALVTQWFAEIQKHCLTSREHKQAGLGNVIKYMAGSRLSSNNDVEMLEQADIVLTTYQEIVKSYPKAAIPLNLTTAAQKDEWWRQHYETNKGIFHQAKFLRIVLDEAQAIKNHKGQTSLAARAISAKFHWAITGTPVMNTVKEFYPYFKFIREPHTGSYALFRENFCSADDPDGAEKLSVFLRKVMIRRTMVDTLFSARLLDLPTPTENTVWLEFNEVERQIYEIVKKRFVQRINSISRSGDLDKSYSHIWTMILRLRQICDHIALAQETIMDLLERDDYEKCRRITQFEDSTSEEGANLLIHLRTVMKNKAGARTTEGGVHGAIISEEETIPIGIIDADPSIDIGGTHGVSFRFRKYLKSLMEGDAWDQIIRRTLCCGCRQQPQAPMVTSCFHVYCASCLVDLQHLSARQGKDATSCKECGETYTSSQPCEVSERKKGKSKEKWINMEGSILPSAKTQATKAQILNWKESNPEVKIIIFTQFIPMITILGRICKTEQWDYVKYTGEMSHEARDKAITEFKDQPNITIMLASLKCGGLGLNLTMASRVICIDPWWNAAVEQQAFCRVFRIGQQSETEMTRFVIKNTIDAAMMAMKERKQIEIDEVMNDAKKNEKPTVADLMRLFGPVQDDENGKPFIFAEADDSYYGHLRLADVDEEDEHHFLGNEE